jgi:membrane-bound lytic murein transglycosylase F
MTPPHRTLPLLLLMLLLGSCSIPPPILEQVKARGELVVATRNSPTTYFEGRDGPEGFEYDLVTAFAAELGVKARFVSRKNREELLGMVARREVDMAVGLPLTKQREQMVKFGPGYQDLVPQVVYREGRPRPKSLRDTLGGTLEVVANSSLEEELKALKELIPELQWNAHPEVENEELLYLVAEEVIDYAVANSNEIALNQRFYPQLKVAFDLPETHSLAWAFPHTQDTSLFDTATAFILKVKQSGWIAELVERYYGYVEQLDYVDTNVFKRHVAQRLPGMQPHFLAAGQETGLDWRLLAAIGYQESHWNAAAVSPTGVRGVMMLTQATARQMGVEDRLDPAASIRGGSRYFASLKGRIPEYISEPDRTWFALAAYNAGLGHLLDAQLLARRAGKDSTKWVEVKEFLPLLSLEVHHSTVPHGYARGRQAVHFVTNVRKYYDLLGFETQQPTPEKDGRERVADQALSLDPRVP